VEAAAAATARRLLRLLAVQVTQTSWLVFAQNRSVAGTEHERRLWRFVCSIRFVMRDRNHEAATDNCSPAWRDDGKAASNIGQRQGYSNLAFDVFALGTNHLDHLTDPSDEVMQV
jgi:hypothetical protein